MLGRAKLEEGYRLDYGDSPGRCSRVLPRRIDTVDTLVRAESVDVSEVEKEKQD
jgi:hypothetical protein